MTDNTVQHNTVQCSTVWRVAFLSNWRSQGQGQGKGKGKGQGQGVKRDRGRVTV